MTKRHTETKAYVKTALTTLLTEQSFETLTVSDLTKRLVSIEEPSTSTTLINLT